MLAPALALIALTLSHASEVVRLRVMPPIDLDAAGGGLRGPEGVGCGGKDLLAVADTGNGRIVLYTVAGATVSPVREVRLPELPYPVHVQVGARGDILALDGKLHRIARLAPTGEFRGYVNPAVGATPGAALPRSFAIDGADRLYLLDVSSARVVVLGPDGRTERQIAYPPGAGFLSDVAVDGGGTVFAIDSVGRRVYVARKGDAALSPLTGTMREDMAFPTAIAVDTLGRIFIADRDGGGIVILGPDGSFRSRQSGAGWKEGTLRYPSGLCVGGAGMLFVADRDNNRIQVFAVPD